LSSIFTAIGVHQFAPAAATEDAVVPGTLGFQVALFLAHNAGAQVVGGLGLAGARDVVQFTFHGEQRRGGDVLGTHALDLAFGRAHIPGAVHQLVFLEHRLDGFQVVVGVHVEHRVVLVVELAVGFGAGVVALDQVLEVVIVAGGVPVRVHRHKARVLQEARVHTPASAGEVVWHAVDHIVFKPLIAAVHGQVVHGRGRSARVNGAAHHGHGQRGGFTAAGHQRHRCQHRHRGLAHADDVAVAVHALQVANELLHVVDVVIQVEFAFGQRHQAGVFPVGDVDLVVLEHGAHGVAQQRGVVPGKRRHHQHHWLVLGLGQRGGVVGKAFETAQFAKGLVQLHPFMDGHAHAVHFHTGDVKGGLFVVLAQPVQQVVPRRNTLCHWDLVEWRQGVAEQFGRGLRKVSKGSIKERWVS
jgi:hypothetical protein